MSCFSDTEKSDAIVILTRACRTILTEYSCSDDIISMIKQCNKQSTLSLSICDQFAISGIFPALVEVCRLIASPLDGPEIAIFTGLNLSSLVQAISQLFANYTARGTPYTLELWKLMKTNNFIGYQHIVSACKRVHNRNATVAAVASIYNCLASFYKLGLQTDTASDAVIEFVRCRPLCCQILLSIDTSNHQSLVHTLSSPDDVSNANDPLAEWMYLLVHLLVRHGDVFELFRTIAPSTPANVDAASCWNEVITHEQVILMNILLDVLDEFITSDKAFTDQVAPVLLLGVGKDGNGSDVLSRSVVANSRFFQQHCLLLNHLITEVIPRCDRRMECCKEIYHGMSQPGRSGGSHSGASLHDEEWLVVTRLCVDVVAAGVLIVPDNPVLGGVGSLLRRNIHGSGPSACLSLTVESADEARFSDRLFVVFRDMMVLLSPPPAVKAPSTSDDSPSYNAVNEGLANSISDKINIEESLRAGDTTSRNSQTNTPAVPGAVSTVAPSKVLSSSSSVLFSNQLLKSVSKCLGNMVYKCKLAQDYLRTSNCMMVVLNHCSTNVNNPLEREYGLMCIRNATENNLENQEFIKQIKKRVRRNAPVRADKIELSEHEGNGLVFYNHVVVGGGIAGTSCIQELYNQGQRMLDNDNVKAPTICLITDSVTVKNSTASVAGEGSLLSEVAIQEHTIEHFKTEFPGVILLTGKLASVSPKAHSLKLTDGRSIYYNKLCLCMGSSPKQLLCPATGESLDPLYDPRHCIHTLRDSDSVEVLRVALRDSSKRVHRPRVAVIGNGGIAMETVHMLLNKSDADTGFQIQWVVKDSYIGNTFFDASVGAFMFPTLRPYMEGTRTHDETAHVAAAGTGDAVIYKSSSDPSSWNTNVGRKERHGVSAKEKNKVCGGAAVGPGWLLQHGGVGAASSPGGGQLQVMYNKTVRHVLVRRPSHSRVDPGPPKLSQTHPECFQDAHRDLNCTEMKFTEGLLRSWLSVCFCWERAPDAGSAVGDTPATMHLDLSEEHINGILNTSSSADLQESGEPARNAGVAGSYRVCADRSGFKSTCECEYEFIFDVLRANLHVEYVGLCSGAVRKLCLHPLYLLLSGEEVIGCDVCITGIGVTANVPPFHYSSKGSEGSGILAAVVPVGAHDAELVVDTDMKVLSSEDIYAAGDCCTVLPEAVFELRAHRDRAFSDWFQMKLWSQARNMGVHAAHCMFGVQEEYGLSFHIFDLFVHVSHFFDYKVVLLGRYNGQGLDTCSNSSGDGNAPNLENITKTIVVTADGLELGNSSINSCANDGFKAAGGGLAANTGARESRSAYEIWTRITTGIEYIKLVVHSATGTIVGALLVSYSKNKDGKGAGSGNSDIEETIEHLMRNKIDVVTTLGGINMLDPDIDIEDFFD